MIRNNPEGRSGPENKEKSSFRKGLEVIIVAVSLVAFCKGVFKTKDAAKAFAESQINNLPEQIEITGDEEEELRMLREKFIQGLFQEGVNQEDIENFIKLEDVPKPYLAEELELEPEPEIPEEEVGSYALAFNFASLLKDHLEKIGGYSLAKSSRYQGDEKEVFGELVENFDSEENPRVSVTIVSDESNLATGICLLQANNDGSYTLNPQSEYDPYRLNDQEFTFTDPRDLAKYLEEINAISKEGFTKYYEENINKGLYPILELLHLVTGIYNQDDRIMYDANSYAKQEGLPTSPQEDMLKAYLEYKLNESGYYD